jgi:hypothetical protein
MASAMGVQVDARELITTGPLKEVIERIASASDDKLMDASDQPPSPRSQGTLQGNLDALRKFAQSTRDSAIAL